MIDDRPRYMISVAAELVGMHPQTLRIYEAKGLLHPRRTPGGTRLYSEADLERLRLIQRLTTELRLNLAGVETVLRLEDELGRLRSRLAPTQDPGGSSQAPEKFGRDPSEPAEQGKRDPVIGRDDEIRRVMQVL